jgi:hypothetical protein
MDAILAVRKGDSGFVLTMNRVDKRREDGLEIAKEMIANLNDQH